MLNPNVGSIVLMSSPLNFFKIVVLPALSRPLPTVVKEQNKFGATTGYRMYICGGSFGSLGSAVDKKNEK